MIKIRKCVHETTLQVKWFNYILIGSVQWTTLLDVSSIKPTQIFSCGSGLVDLIKVHFEPINKPIKEHNYIKL